MSQVLENNKWWRDKRPIIDGYLESAKQIENTVAGNGLLYRPGFLGEIISIVERKAKFDLSEVNYQIVAEAITRELAQTGHAYDIAVKEAMIAWELERTVLFTALDQEFADNKRVRDLDNQALDRLEITTNLRKLVIMALKTAIDIEIEELRQEMTLVDKSTFSAEDALLAAKLLTAQKKLEVIPYIETVIEKQRRVITAEGANADRKTALITVKEDLNDKRGDLIDARELIADAIIGLIAAKQVLVVKRQALITAKGLISVVELQNVGYLEQYILALSGLDDVRQDLITAKKNLIPYINDKSTALIAHAAEIDAWIVVKEAIADIKEEMATLREERVDKRGDIIDSRVALNILELALREANLGLRTARMVGLSDLLSAKIENAADWLEERETALTAEITRVSELTGAQVDLEMYAKQIALETMREVNALELPAKKNEIRRVAEAWIHEREETADIVADTKITSQLVHLLK